jgi:hypothetical protein
MIGTRQISITVDEKTAFLYDGASENKKQGLNFILYEWLKEDPNKDSLALLMDKIGFQSINNGLTEEKLSNLLAQD